MKKFLFFALMAVVLGACSANNPDSKSGYIQKVQLSDEQIKMWELQISQIAENQ